MDPENYSARFGLATAYTRLENYRAALDHVKWCTTKQPENNAALLLMGELQMALKRFKEAKKSLEKLHGRAPKTAGLSRMLGRLAFKEGEFEKALPLLAEATFGKNVDAEIHFEHGECLYRMGKFNESMQKFNLVEQRLKGNDNRKTLYLQAERRLAQSKARIRQFGQVVNDGLTFEDTQRQVKATRSYDDGWAWVYPTKTPSLVCCLALPDDEIVITVGHNPGMEELVEGLTGDSVTMPTAALASIRCRCSSWQELMLNGSAELSRLWVPRALSV